MKCPTCANTPLVMAERQGVEIDYCPSCRGIWLDRGELDKLLDNTQQDVRVFDDTRFAEMVGALNTFMRTAFDAVVEQPPGPPLPTST